MPVLPPGEIPYAMLHMHSAGGMMSETATFYYSMACENRLPFWLSCLLNEMHGKNRLSTAPRSSGFFKTIVGKLESPTVLSHVPHHLVRYAIWQFHPDLQGDLDIGPDDSR